MIVISICRLHSNIQLQTSSQQCHYQIYLFSHHPDGIVYYYIHFTGRQPGHLEQEFSKSSKLRSMRACAIEVS